MVGWEGCPLYGTVVLCQAGSAAAFHAPGASTAWEGDTVLPFSWSREPRVDACYFASAALSFESAAEETGRRELWLARPISWTARELPADRIELRENPRVTAAHEREAQLAIARPHSWCTSQEKAPLDESRALVHYQARSASLRAPSLGERCNSPSPHGPRAAPDLEILT